MKYNPPLGSTDPNAPYENGKPGIKRGSVVTAEALEFPQREIVRVIEEAGLEPDNSDLSQLLQAIRHIVNEKAGYEIGDIITWSGEFMPDGVTPKKKDGNPRLGWQLCNGTNGTPDLRDRFLIGSGNAYTQNQKGGNSTCTGSISNTTPGNVGYSSLSINQMPLHNHRIQGAVTTGSGMFTGFLTNIDSSNTYTVSNGANESHSHTSAPHAHTFTGSANSNLPPYYALPYIMYIGE